MALSVVSSCNRYQQDHIYGRMMVADNFESYSKIKTLSVGFPPKNKFWFGRGVLFTVVYTINPVKGTVCNFM